MKGQVKSVNCVFAWSWQFPKDDEMKEISSSTKYDHLLRNQANGNADDSEEEVDELCGICRASFNRTCPNCKYPSDGCPIVIGQCKHNFHVHCITEWLGTEASRGLCPMCRQPFQLRKGIAINDLHYDAFKEIILKRQREQNEFDANMEDDEVLARVIAAQEGQNSASNDDPTADNIMDQDMVVR